MERIHIAITHNDFYTEHCVVCMTSICQNSKDDKLVFHIIDGGLQENSKQQIKKVAEIYQNCEIEFNQVDNEIFKDFVQSDYYTVQILWTMILPQIKDLQRLKRLIYLDCDLICHSSLKELWQIDLKDNYLAAVEDANGKKYSRRYLDGKAKFFNTGLMVINCQKWRDENICEKAVKLAIENTGTPLGYDQTVLNKLFINKVEYLNLKWNLQYSPLNIWASYENKLEYRQAADNPNIIHYVGDYKPWVQGLGCFNPKQKDYFKYHELTAYKKSNYKSWFLYDKLFCIKGLLAFVKRYPLFFLKRNFWENVVIRR